MREVQRQKTQVSAGRGRPLPELRESRHRVPVDRKDDAGAVLGTVRKP